MNKAFQSGLEAYQMRDFKKAAAFFQEACNEEPANANYLFYCGSALAESGEVTQAAEALEKALQNADAVPIRYMLAELNLNAGKVCEAEADFSRIIESPAGERYWQSLSFLGLGLIKLEAGDLETAIADFTRAEEVAKEDGDSALLARIAATLEKNGF
jgi:Putative Zn-dependent protease, contains TPR repeats